MPTLKLVCNFTLTSQGTTITGKQGAAADGFSTPFDLTVSGTVHGGPGSLDTATARTVWDDDDDAPVGFDYAFYKADQDTYIQFIASATNFIVPVEANVPFIMSAATLLAAVSTTAMSGSAPSVTEIDSIVIQNNSGTTTNYVFWVVD